jgi:hypothetical protein
MKKKFWAKIVPILASRPGREICCQSASVQMAITALVGAAPALVFGKKTRGVNATTDIVLQGSVQ